MRCNDNQLHVLLHDDEDSTEFRIAASHVELCSTCRQRLVDMSSDESLLREVRETLCAIEESGRETIQNTAPYRSGFTSSVTIAVEGISLAGNSDDDIGAECEPVSLDFLSPPSHPEMLGRIGRYEIERMIGSGGMGIVLKAFDTELHRVVAIKVLKPHLAHNGAARRRFAREAQSAAAVVHEHVIPIHDVLTDGDTPYLVMQYVPGQSLQARVDERGPLDAKEVLRIARQAAAGLAAAHAQGVVHRDVKPANILLEESVDRVLISDFGLARTVDDATLTRTGVVAGTPHYMSPEQAAGHSVDHRSDLFSLGSSIYFMCTGRPPFRADHALAILNRICNDEHRPVEEVNPDVPAELANVIDRLLSKNPAHRFRDAEHVERTLGAILLQLQSGRRSNHLKWHRMMHRWRRVLRFSMTSVVAATVFTVLGFDAAYWLLRGDRIESGSAEIMPVASLAPVIEPVNPSSPVVLLPPDTFARDLLQLQDRLNNMESSWNQDSKFAGQDTDPWRNDLEALRGQLESSHHAPP